MISDKYALINLNRESQIPLANQLAQQLTWLMADGVLKQGETLPPIREFAVVLEIHYHTVRAAYHQLEEQGLVSIQPMVGTVVKEYNPFSLPSTNESEPGKLVGILLPSLSDFYQQIINGMNQVAQACGIMPVILTCGDNPVYAERVYQKIRAKGFSGVINVSLGFSEEFFQRMHSSGSMGAPLVFLDVNEPDTHRIVIDTCSCISIATEHMIDHGYERIALVNCPSDWAIGQEAFKGFQQAFIQNGIPESISQIFTVPGFTLDIGRFIAERMLQEDTLPQAIVTVSDNLALGMMSRLKERGVRVPTDVAIIGYNDIFPSSLVTPSLSSIALPLFDMGVQTMEAMDKVMSGKMTFWIKKVFSGRLVKRSSCGCSLEGGKNEEEG